MKRGFTLLELVVVIIIIGIMGTLGIQQYGRMTERARGAEGRTILGQIRGAAAAYRLERGTCVGFNNAFAGIGPSTDQIPDACTAARRTHYFSYSVTGAIADGVTLQATRCTGGNGKNPGAATALDLVLTTDFVAGTDSWTGTGGY